MLTWGSRGSPLALAQSRMVAAMLARVQDGAYPIQSFTTTGDRIAGVRMDSPRFKNTAFPNPAADRLIFCTGFRTDWALRPEFNRRKDVVARFRREARTLAALTPGRIIAAAAIIGLSKMPNNGYSNPAAMGMPSTL